MSAAGTPFTATPTGPRSRAVGGAVLPTARGFHLGAAAATVAAGGIPVVVSVARGDTDLTAPLVIAGVVAGAALGWAADDPAADLLGAMPLSTPIRSALRVALVACVAVIGAAIVALVVAVGPGLPHDLGDRVPEASAAAALALAVGFLAARRGERAPGPIGVTAGVLGPPVIAALAFRWPEVFPGFMLGPVHHRWWFVVALSAAVAVRAGRDPGRR
ncbi:MAG: hypothetical protein ACSLFP_10740 [Acidimicrobiales bacterium]